MVRHGRDLTLGASLIVLAGAPAPAAGQLAQCAEGLLDSMQLEYGIPALAVAVTRGDTVLFNTARGAAHIESGTLATPSTIFQLSSTSRVFTGVLVMRMAAQGLVELDAPASPHLDAAPAGWDRVTVRHLVSNTSGLRDIGDVDLESTAPASPQAILRELYRRAPAPEPGTSWAYSIADYLVLQQILERAGGAPFHELMQREVFDRAGMTSAQYWPSHRDVIIGAATGYYPDSTVTPRWYEQRDFEFPEHLLAAGGAAASLEDLIRFDRALRDGRLLEPGVREGMWEDVQLENGRTVSYGLGWDTKTHAPGQRSAGHSGGFLTTFRTWPGSRLTAIVLTNGFLHPINTDDIATAFAAVWDPAIIGFTAPACDAAHLAGARF